jgi:hypothetical protein
LAGPPPHGGNPKPRKQFGESVLPQLVAHGGECGGKRFGRSIGAVVRLTQGASARPFLCKVDEVEVTRERSSDKLSPIERPRPDQRVRLPCRAAAQGTVTARTDDRPAQRLDILKERVAAMLRDHLPEHIAENAHLISDRRRHLLTRRSRALVGTLSRARGVAMRGKPSDTPRVDGVLDQQNGSE